MRRNLAVRSYARALEIARELHREAPDSTDRQTLLAWCLGNLGLWHLSRGELDEARRFLASELEVVQRGIDRSEGDHGLCRVLANTLQQLGTVDGLQGDHEAALENLDRARFLYHELVADSPKDQDLAIILAAITGKCGMARFQLGDESGIDDLLDECDMLQAILDQDPNHAPAQWLLAETRLVLCQLETARPDLEAAREHGNEALWILEALAEREPAGVKYRRLMSAVSYNLGMVAEAAASGESDSELAGDHRLDAIRWFERSLELTEALDREGALPPQDRNHPERIREHLERARDEF